MNTKSHRETETETEREREWVAQSMSICCRKPKVSTTKRGQHMDWAMRNLPSSKRYGFGALLWRAIITVAELARANVCVCVCVCEGGSRGSILYWLSIMLGQTMPYTEKCSVLSTLSVPSSCRRRPWFKGSNPLMQWFCSFCSCFP